MMFTEQAVMPPNRAIDSDTYLAPLRGPVSTRHCERWASGIGREYTTFIFRSR